MPRLLVIRFSAMGDVAMTVPVLKTALKDFPDLEITIVTSSFLTPLFEGTERLHAVAADLKGKHRGILGIYHLYRDLTASEKYDAVLDLHDVLRSRILCGFLRLHHSKFFRIQKGRREKTQMLHSKQLRPLLHSTERYRQVFEQAGYFITSKFDNFPFITSPQKFNECIEKLTNTFHRPMIGFAPFAKHPSKTLPLDQSESLINMLSRQYDILLLGGPSDQSQFSKWETSFEHVHSTTGFSFQDQLTLMQKMKAVISMDSANMHLAAIQGIPVLSIWGGTHPYFGFSSLGSKEENWVIAAPRVSCSPCSVFGNKPCNNKEAPYDCFRKISNDTILSKLEHLLNQHIKA